MKWWHVLTRLCHSINSISDIASPFMFFALRRFFWFPFSFLFHIHFKLITSSCVFIFSRARAFTYTQHRKCNEHYSPFVCLVFDLLHSKTIQHRLQWNKLQSACMLVYTINQHNCIEHPTCQNNKKDKKKLNVNTKKNPISSLYACLMFVRFFSPFKFEQFWKVHILNVWWNHFKMVTYIINKWIFYLDIFQ